MHAAQAVWVGTRFVCAKEAGAPPRHQQAIIDADYHDTIRTLIYTGRPLRVLKNEYISKWENEHAQEIKELCSKVSSSHAPLPPLKGPRRSVTHFTSIHPSSCF